MLAVELFETTEGTLPVNELAMRPHNSGHWTMDGSVTSQLEQHLRAASPVPVMANVLGAPQTPSMSLDERLHHLFGRIPGARVHLYGKGECPGRKAGNVDIVGGDAVSSACLRRSASFPAGV